MRRSEQWASTGILLYLGYSIFVTFTEFFVIAPTDRVAYFPLKILALFLAGPAWLILRRDAESFCGNLILAVSMTMYCCVGLWFRPLYGFAYAELILLFSFSFTPPRKLFFTTVALSSGLLIGIYAYRFSYLEQLLKNPQFVDVPLTIGAFGVIAVFIYVSFTQEKVWREAALTRFGLVGQHASSLLHDLKGQLAVPMMQLEALKELVGENADSELVQTLSEIEKNMVGIVRTVGNINQMSRLARKEHEWFSVRSVIGETTTLLKPKLSVVDFEIDGEFECLGDSALMASISLALFVNSFESFADGKIDQPKIRIELREGLFRFSDNGGGFSDAILKMMKTGSPATNKDSGTGLGLFLVRSAMADMRGRVRLYNQDKHAVVDISLPKSGWKKTAQLEA